MKHFEAFELVRIMEFDENQNNRLETLLTCFLVLHSRLLLSVGCSSSAMT